MVLAANGKHNVATVALRPSGIFGEDDPLFIPSLVRNAKLGKMKYIIGSGTNMMDFTYVGNVAAAHLMVSNCARRCACLQLHPRLLQASQALSSPRASAVAGKAYFITNDEPKLLWRFFADILSGLGYQRPSIRLPLGLVLGLAMIFEYMVSSS